MPDEDPSEGDVEAMLKRLQKKEAQAAAKKEKDLEPVQFSDPPAEVPEEDDEQSWRDKPGTAIPDSIVEKIREMKREGANYETIKKALGVSENSISKYTPDIPSVRGRKGSDAKGTKARVQSRSTNPVDYSQKRMLGEITKSVAQEALAKFQQILEVGKPVIDTWENAAERRGYDLVDYIELAVDFFEAYDSYIDKLERDNKALKYLLGYLSQRAAPQLKREEDIHLYFAACMVAETNPDPKDVLQLIRAGT